MGSNRFVYLLDEHSRWWAFWLYQATAPRLTGRGRGRLVPPYDGGAMVTVMVPL